MGCAQSVALDASQPRSQGQGRGKKRVIPLTGAASKGLVVPPRRSSIVPLPDDLQPSAAAKPALSAREQFASEYELGNTLGKGSFGIVMSARERSSQSLDAVKIIDSREGQDRKRELAMQEVKVWRAVGRHPSVAELRRVFCDSRVVFMVMERCECTVSEKADSNPELLQSGLPHLLHQMLLGLEACHRASVVHRDVKPDNCLQLNHVVVASNIQPLLEIIGQSSTIFKSTAEVDDLIMFTVMGETNRIDQCNDISSLSDVMTIKTKPEAGNDGISSETATGEKREPSCTSVPWWVTCSVFLLTAIFFLMWGIKCIASSIMTMGIMMISNFNYTNCLSEIPWVGSDFDRGNLDTEVGNFDDDFTFGMIIHYVITTMGIKMMVNLDYTDSISEIPCAGSDFDRGNFLSEVGNFERALINDTMCSYFSTTVNRIDSSFGRSDYQTEQGIATHMMDISGIQKTNDHTNDEDNNCTMRERQGQPQLMSPPYWTGVNLEITAAWEKVFSSAPGA
ncbi:unnamed protein product [Prorocentrum cordatum]|uniref:Protein kinase domain-containing protein n=1 Tax=Prorocentrum cordatum TaxID=2364126 RepID=A0ABN9V2U9_9DINO|nr:unnamed protein product [Polarella glacialis]